LINFGNGVFQNFQTGNKMNQVKAVFMYVLALVVLLAPAILIGWMGFTLLGWWGGIIGIIGGLIIFAFSLNKIAAQNDDADETVEETEKAEAVETGVEAEVRGHKTGVR
jgi:small neutral amino acid transporter SnatA (MarC family)